MIEFTKDGKPALNWGAMARQYCLTCGKQIIQERRVDWDPCRGVKYQYTTLIDSKEYSMSRMFKPLWFHKYKICESCLAQKGIMRRANDEIKKQSKERAKSLIGVRREHLKYTTKTYREEIKKLKEEIKSLNVFLA